MKLTRHAWCARQRTRVHAVRAFTNAQISIVEGVSSNNKRVVRWKRLVPNERPNAGVASRIGDPGVADQRMYYTGYVTCTDKIYAIKCNSYAAST